MSFPAPNSKAITELRKGDTFVHGGYTFTVRTVNRTKGHPSTKGKEFVQVITTPVDAPTRSRTAVFTATEDTISDRFVKILR